MSLNRFERCIVTIGTVALMLGLFWIACSQKTPIDPTSSIQKEVPILANITASPSQVAVGGAQSEIRVQLVDQEGHPLSNEQVTFSTNLGSTTSEDLTDQNGWAVAVLTSGQTPGNARVTARYGKLASVSVTVKFISSYQAQIQINSYRKEILANGVDTTAITITLLGDSAKPVAGAVVSLSRSLGTIPSSVMTGAEGKGKVYLTSIANSQDTTTTVTATYDTLPPVAIVVFFKGIQFSVEANPTSILADGGSKSTIRAILKETSSHIALSDAEIRFGTTLGTIPAVEHTDASGVAEVSLTSGTTPGTAVVVARYGNVLLDTARVAFGQLQYSLDLKSDPDAILANGEETATISATVKDSKGQPVSGLPVKFSATAGIIDSAGATNSSGIAEAVLRSVADSTDILDTVTATVEGVSKTIQVTLQGIRFKLKADPAYIVADGQSQSVITVTLKETTTQVGIVGAHIQFGTTLGKIPAEGITDNQGVVSVPLTSGTVLGIAEVVARYGKTFLDTVPVSFGSSSPATLSAINASPSAILANGVDQSTVIAKVVDSNSNSVSGVVVSFTTTAGTVQSQGITDNNGFATAVLTSSASETDINATVTAHLGTQSVPTTVVFQGVTMELSVSPDTILADGESQSVITVILKRATSNVAISGAEISFGTDHGTIPSSATTNASGIVQVTLTSEATPNTAHVVASYGAGISKTDSVIFVSSLPSGNALSSINASPSAILANGVDQSTVTAKVVDNNLNPVSGVVIGFTTTAGTVQSQSITDNNGFATAVLTSDTSSTDINATVTAHLGTQSAQTVVVFQGVTMNISASPGTILADGQSQSVITVILKRATSNIAVSGAVITFGTDLGTISNEATTNSGGVAEVSLTSGTATGTAHVVASYGAGISRTTTVVFQESVPSNLEVSATPTVITADGQSQSIIKATVSDANRNPVPDGTLVVFDIAEGSGTIGRQRTTVGGVAATTLTSGTQPDTAKIIGSVGSLADTVMVVYVVGAVDRIEVTADPDSIPADGITTSRIRARVLDTKNNPIEGVTVEFSASVGDIVQSVRTNSEGLAEAEYSSKVVGLATITAEVGGVFGTTSIQVIPGGPYSITITYEPHFIYVRDCGKNQTATIYAEVLDEKNNPVANGTLVKFSIYASPGADSVEGGRLSSKLAIPTVEGVAQVSYISGIRAGASRIRADVTADADGNPVSPSVMGISTEIVIFAGPPYIENINDPSSSHLSVGVEWGKQNMWHWIETSEITVLVGDKYNNPVQEGTAVYLTTSGGVITTKAYTDANGIAKAILQSGNPEPTIDRFYNYIGMQDPNTGAPIGDHDTDPRIKDFEVSRVQNSEGDFGENDGIARIIAYSEGVDSLGNSARAWCENWSVFSRSIYHFDVFSDKTILSPGEFASITIECWDKNGNPVVGGSTLEASAKPADVAELSWTSKTTDDPGSCYYGLTVTNTVNPQDTTAMASWTTVTVKIEGKNGKREAAVQIFCDIK